MRGSRLPWENERDPMRAIGGVWSAPLPGECAAFFFYVEAQCVVPFRTESDRYRSFVCA